MNRKDCPQNKWHKTKLTIFHLFLTYLKNLGAFEYAKFASFPEWCSTYLWLYYVRSIAWFCKISQNLNICARSKVHSEMNLTNINDYIVTKISLAKNLFMPIASDDFNFSSFP